MSNNRDESELTFEGMTARVRRFLTRVYRFPHDWGVPEPQTPENGDAIIHRRMEELRIYGCSPVPASRLLGRNSIASGSGRPAPSPCSSSANTDIGSPHSTAALSATHREPRASDPGEAGGQTKMHDREGAGDPSRRRGNITEQFLQKRPRLFRHDAKRLKRLIASAEHMIRCLIIWRAYRAMRDEKISARFQPIPTPPPAGTPRRPQPSIHPHFAVRGLPLYEPRAPVFRISMPLETKSPSPSKGEGFGMRVNRPPEQRVSIGQSPPHPKSLSPMKGARDFRRPRNDDLSTHERLYLRLERLGRLYDEVDQRGARLASRWAGYVQGPVLNSSHPTRFGGSEIDPVNRSPDKREGAGDLSRRRGNITEQTSRHTSEPDWATGESPPAALSPFYANPGSREQEMSSHALQRIGARSKIRPLKSHDPPPDLLETATEDEAEDLHILHDAAIRAAEDFPSLCG